MSTGLKLYLYQNNTLFKKIAFSNDQKYVVVIGTGDQASLKLSNKLISSNHAQLVYDSKNQLHLQDLNSTNGTFLNGSKISPSKTYIVNPKDKIQLAAAEGVLIIVETLGTNSISEDKINILDQLKTKSTIVIGRADECEVVLNSSSVSRQHAEICKQANGTYTIKDLNSTNGTFVNGYKIKGAQPISLSDKIFIGKLQLSLEGATKDLSEELAICVKGIEKEFINSGKKIKVLNKMDLAIPSKSLLAIMGPSGCGKTTLMNTLNGVSPATNGKVYLFGQELISNYEYLKTQIGYVPQDDTIHRQLTVEQSLYYTAKLRLNNFTDIEIDCKIDEILDQLGVLHVKNNLISKISGGQRKRVCIALELLSEPLILFLDEPTSPLDPQTIEDFLNILKDLSKRGTTVIMVTHKPEDLEYMDEVIFLAKGGNPAYFGDSKSYKNYFGVKTAVSVFSLLSDSYWTEKYTNPRPVSKVLETDSVLSKSLNKSLNKSFYEQYKWLSKRYFKIKTNDKANSIVMLLQAPIIAVLICLVFKNINPAVPFITALSAIWFGTNNAAREIVSELSIFKRERMFNMDISPYVLSKISVLAFFSIIQSAIFIGILFLHYSTNDIVVYNAPLSAFLWMSFLSIAATFLGLLLSATLATAEKVMTIVPIILIPQIMLAGLVAKIETPFVEIISYLTFTRWGTEGFNALQEQVVISIPTDLGVMQTTSNAIENLKLKFYDSYTEWFGDLAGTLKLDIIAVLLLMILMTYFIFRQLKKKVEVL
ncbi:FHA domain-containing protein [Flavobacteriaceae bacterium]|nr:FHA domain-containing protein [Flavobacteriaceae bacterium]